MKTGINNTRTTDNAAVWIYSHNFGLNPYLYIIAVLSPDCKQELELTFRNKETATNFYDKMKTTTTTKQRDEIYEEFKLLKSKDTSQH